MIAKGEGGFLNGDLYPFCFNNTDGKVQPFPNPNAKALFGADERTIKDAAGKNYGQGCSPPRKSRKVRFPK